jgi:hypothetical protein
LCTPHDVFVIQLKCKCLVATLIHALTHYTSTVNFIDICKFAIEKVNNNDFNGFADDMDHDTVCSEGETDKDGKMMKITNADTVMCWLCTQFNSTLLASWVHLLVSLSLF